MTVPQAPLKGWVEAHVRGVGGCHGVVESGCHACGGVLCACDDLGRAHDVLVRAHDVLVQLSGDGVGEEGHGGDALARLSDGVGEEGHGGVHGASGHE